MLSGRSPGDVPELAEPGVVVLLINHRESALFLRRLAIAAGLPLHQDKLDVVLNDGIRLVGFAEEFGAVLNLIIGIGNLVPDDRIQIIEAQVTATDTNVSMQWKHSMTTESTARYANVANHTHQTATRYQYAEALFEHLTKLGQELLVVVDVTKLGWGLVVPLKIPIGGRSNNEMHRFIGEERHAPMTSDTSTNESCSRCTSAARAFGMRSARPLPHF